MTRPQNTINSIGMRMIPIKAGSFLMGSPKDETGRMIDEQEHVVTITNDFIIQDTLVTMKQWRIFIDDTGYKTEAETGQGAWVHIREGFIWWNIFGKLRLPYLPDWSWKILPGYSWDKPGFEQSDDHPVTCISWNDAHTFSKWLSHKENRQYRLPTEAEWEYSCRAGTKTAYSFGADITPKQANFSRNVFLDTIRNYTPQRTTRTKSYLANTWELYDMHANVWEWCEDKCDKGMHVSTDTYQQNIQDPLCSNGECRILRGGSWAYDKSYCRSAYRRSWPPDSCASGIGFRVVIVS